MTAFNISFIKNVSKILSNIQIFLKLIIVLNTNSNSKSKAISTIERSC